jgi:hypothetical protein
MRKLFPLSFVGLLLLPSCKDPGSDGASNGTDSTAQRTSTPPSTDANGIALTSLEGSGLRFNGVYRNDLGGVSQLIRFFPRGTAVTANDRSTVIDSLRPVLVEDMEPNIGAGFHNVAVTLRNDSILFRTTIISGYINYAGALHGPDTIVFLKENPDKGRRMILPYYFVQD